MMTGAMTGGMAFGSRPMHTSSMHTHTTGAHELMTGVMGGHDPNTDASPDRPNVYRYSTRTDQLHSNNTFNASSGRPSAGPSKVRSNGINQLSHVRRTNITFNDFKVIFTSFITRMHTLIHYTYTDTYIHCSSSHLHNILFKYTYIDIDIIYLHKQLSFK